MLDRWGENAAQRAQLTVARQEIEYLRRLYGAATDALGRWEDEASLAYGQSVYRRIFTASAEIRVAGSSVALTGKGPDAWVAVVKNALKDYETTQHLIGTQLVTFSKVTFAGDEIVAGQALLTSYLHAWHAWPDRALRLVLGTYTDEVVYSPDVGWQIFDMTLAHTSSEARIMGDPA